MENQYEILIVDDNPANLRMLTQLLTRHHYRARGVLSGNQALAILDSNPPDLILLDLMMPGIDGYEVCERVKAHPDGKHIPIIFITALGGVQDKVKAFQAGGADYITKPFQVEEIIARMETHLALRNMQRQHQIETKELKDRLTAAGKLLKNYKQKIEELAAYDLSVSHNLKEPLNDIYTTAEWLQQSYNQLKTEQLTHYLEQLAAGAYRANNTISSLLILAETDKIPVYPVDMHGAAQRSLQHLQALISERETRLIFPDTLPQAMGQTPLVEQVWDNYLSNAIKYGGTPPYIGIGANVQNNHMIRYWVIDNGPGIPQEKQAHIFVSHNWTNEGTVESHGLGLAIVKRIVEKLGGQVGFENLPQQGCRFYFTLPAISDGS